MIVRNKAEVGAEFCSGIINQLALEQDQDWEALFAPDVLGEVPAHLAGSMDHLPDVAELGAFKQQEEVACRHPRENAGSSRWNAPDLEPGRREVVYFGGDIGQLLGR